MVPKNSGIIEAKPPLGAAEFGQSLAAYFSDYARQAFTHAVLGHRLFIAEMKEFETPHKGNSKHENKTIT